jgi:hypothetical protein
MDKTLTRGLTVHFVDGSKINVSFPTQTEDQYRRKLGVEEILKRRALILELDGAAHVIPFENVKYLTVFPAPEFGELGVIKGGSISD